MAKLELYDRIHAAMAEDAAVSAASRALADVSEGQLDSKDLDARIAAFRAATARFSSSVQDGTARHLIETLMVYGELSPIVGPLYLRRVIEPGRRARHVRDNVYSIAPREGTETFDEAIQATNVARFLYQRRQRGATPEQLEDIEQGINARNDAARLRYS